MCLMFCLALLFACLCRYCNAQEFDVDCNEIEGCGSEVTKCIGEYIDLEMYILNNKALLEKLAETFFPTGRGVSKFAKISYNFQTSSDMQMMRSVENSVENNITNCSYQQSIHTFGVRWHFIPSWPKANVLVNIVCCEYTWSWHYHWVTMSL